MFKKLRTLLIPIITSLTLSLFLISFASAKAKTNDYQIISAGTIHSLAVKSDGTLWAWGDNSDGEVGDGTTTDRHSPVQFQLILGIKAMPWIYLLLLN
jgi:hypothetical protein